MRTKEEACSFGLEFENTYLDKPFRKADWQLIRIKDTKKAFLCVYERDGFVNLNVKVDPAWRDFWRNTYLSVVPGYHQNKEHWNTIILDGSIKDEDIKRMIAESYDLVTDSPTKRIYEAVKRIPKGKVATYGKVAEMAGNKKMSRAVGNALHIIADIVTIYIFVRKYPMKNRDTNIASRKNTFGEWISKHIWYSYMPFNIDGRTNLLFMFFWGIVALVWFKFVYPPFSKFIEKIPPVTGSVLAVFIALFFICNGTVTSMVMIRTTDRKKHPEARNVIEQFIDNEYPNEVVRKLWPNMNFLEE